MIETIPYGHLKRRVPREPIGTQMEGPLRAFSIPHHHENNVSMRLTYVASKRKAVVNLWTFEHRRTLEINDEVVEKFEYMERANYSNSIRSQFIYDLYTYYMIGDM